MDKTTEVCEHDVTFYPVAIPVDFKTVKEYNDLIEKTSTAQLIIKHFLGSSEKKRFHWYCSKCFKEFEPVFKEIQ